MEDKKLRQRIRLYRRRTGILSVEGFRKRTHEMRGLPQSEKRTAQPVPQKSLLKKESTGQRRSFYLSRAENFAFSPLKKSAMSSVSRIFTAR